MENNSPCIYYCYSMNNVKKNNLLSVYTYIKFSMVKVIITMNKKSGIYAKERKEKIISSHFGENWKIEYSNMSIDALYKKAIGDERKTLFCKVTPECKKFLDEMVEHNDIMKSELVESMIRKEYSKFKNNMDYKIDNLINQFVDLNEK